MAWGWAGCTTAAPQAGEESEVPAPGLAKLAKTPNRLKPHKTIAPEVTCGWPRHSGAFGYTQD
jgi:hypothetical protein